MNNYVKTYFSPNRGTASEVIGFINRCQTTLDIAIYSITHDEICDALIAAHNRGVKIRVLIDSLQSHNMYSDDEKLQAAGIQVLRDVKTGIMHHKFAIDGITAIGLGSFNWTKNADEKNCENWNVIRLQYVVNTYQQEFNRLWQLNKS
jgi:phosphatidylserine/phosphatidylglycerophosphate/cardiolipin synthase-like enzyme